MLNEVRLEFFLENIKNKGLKIHYFIPKMYTWAYKLYNLGLQIWGVRGWPGPQGPLDLLVPPDIGMGLVILGLVQKLEGSSMPSPSTWHRHFGILSFLDSGRKVGK